MARIPTVDVAVGEGGLGQGWDHEATSAAPEDTLHGGESRPSVLDRLVVAGPKARYALAAIRVANGIAALVAPSIIVKRCGEVPGQSVAATYGLRMFGIRNVLIGADLVTQRGQPLLYTTAQAVVIHATDAITAAGLGVSGRLRPRLAIPLVVISGTNTVLAILSWLDSRRENRS